MVSLDSINFSNAGGTATSSTSTAIVVSLVGGDETVADSTVVVGFIGEGLTFATPAGWAVVGTPASGLSVYRRGPVEGLVAAETSWNFTPSATAGKAVEWGVLDIAGIDPDDPVNGVGTVSVDTSVGVDLASGFAFGDTYDGLAVFFHCNRDSTNATPGTFFPETSGVTEIIEDGQAGTGNSVDMAISARPVTATGNVSAGAEYSRNLGPSSPGVAIALILSAVGARKATDVWHIDGAEHGNALGNDSALGPAAASRILANGGMTAGVSITSGAARSGGYGWLLSSSAAACTFTFDTISSITFGASIGWRRAFRLPTLPAQDTLLWTVGPNVTARNIQIWFRVAGGNLGMILDGGTVDAAEVLSDDVITADQWFAVEVKWDGSAYAVGDYAASWSVDYNAELTDTTPAVPQTGSTVDGGTAGAYTSYTQRVGWATALTQIMHSDDSAAFSPKSYPIGDLRCLPLKVDPAGTPTISGTTTNFGVMTANGTVAAWNATNARNAVDDVAPDLSATRDAAVCIAAHATDYMEFPMQTRDLAANAENVRGANLVMSIWAASTTACTMRASVTDGTATYALYAEADPGADNTSTPVWIQKMVRTGASAPIWDQAAVDGLATRIGSNDATPDIGPDCILIVLAVIKAQPEALFGEPGEPVYVEAHRDPVTQALVGAAVTTDADNTVELTWEVDGVPDSSGSIPPSTTAQYVPMSADGTIETVGTVSLIPG